MASGSASALSTGEHIIIGGLVVQLIFFSLFLGPTPMHVHLVQKAYDTCKQSYRPPCSTVRIV